MNGVALASSRASSTDDPVLLALADSQKRFNIPLELLEKLVHGTAMDCRHDRREHPQLQYETFDQLYDYCYHVASVVGLICIRIFGYRDPRAEKLAERTGVAFQLTNILRDVKEDWQMGRVYLPQEDLARFGIDVHVLTNGARRLRCGRCWSSKPSARASTIARPTNFCR